MSSHEFRQIPPRGTNVEDNAQRSAPRRYVAPAPHGQSQEAANSLVLRIKRCASPIDVTNTDDPAGWSEAPGHCRSASTGRRKCVQDLMGKNRIEVLSGEV